MQGRVIASFCGKWKVYLAKVSLSNKNGYEKYALERMKREGVPSVLRDWNETREAESGLYYVNGQTRELG